ncbi:MAG: alanine--tRNA ligase [Gammaproteobacteria bacterium]|jgi:alanyl-tRNA synthetase
MQSHSIRQAYLDYFKQEGHTIVDSSSLVPDNDPTLLFTNSGMVQFKEAFALREDRGYTRAASCQRCIRAGGKHNDLDNVGYTARHHTFFEMLGNFSFGDYFKSEAIRFSWEFLTQVLKLPKDKLWVTIHDSDDEAWDIWVNEIGFDPNRMSRMGDKDNFWTMGDTGPCGPCSEIFFDHGDSVPGGPPGSPDDDLDRYIEIWNLVFTQYDRQADGELIPLPSPCVDTGMGLERLAAVMQDVHNNYDTDLFQPIIRAAAQRLLVEDIEHPSLKVIADHLRSAVFLITDGVLPSNEGRGYVMRRIIRRALRHGHALGATEPFFCELVQTLAETMQHAYPFVSEMREQIERVLRKEEEQFQLTLDQGMRILEDALAGLGDETIPGEVVFKLYDTYGFPTDLTGDIARERGLQLDMEGFEAAMEAQRARARSASRFSAAEDQDLTFEGTSTFNGYNALSQQAEVVALFKEGAAEQSLNVGDEGYMVLNATPFYAESGGQVGDTGMVAANGVQVRVLDTIKSGETHLHRVMVEEGTLEVGLQCDADVEATRRAATARHHSATHLLHAALREVLGTHVNQRGSLVDDEKLRFDFSHFEAVTDEELSQIEQRVNEEILRNTEVVTEEMAIEAAREKGAMALFGEKYSQSVRVLTMGEGFSIELCGGTHVQRTGDIGLFKIVSEQGIASGVRRIEAISGLRAASWVNEMEGQLVALGRQLKTDPAQLSQRIDAMVENQRRLEKELADLNARLLSGGSSETEVEEVAGISLIAKRVEGADPKSLPDAVDKMKNKLGSGVVVLASVQGGRIALIAGVTQDLTDRLDAGQIVNHVAQQVGGKGGGRKDLARAGGDQVDELDGALESVVGFVEKALV